MSYYALQLTCPHCQEFGEHKTIRTDPNTYHWSKETVLLFTLIAGQDIRYRVRERRCEHCNQVFKATELPHVFLEALVNEVIKLTNENCGLREQAKRLQNAIDKASQILAPHQIPGQ